MLKVELSIALNFKGDTELAPIYYLRLELYLYNSHFKIYTYIPIYHEKIISSMQTNLCSLTRPGYLLTLHPLLYFCNQLVHCSY